MHACTHTLAHSGVASLCDGSWSTWECPRGSQARGRPSNCEVALPSWVRQALCRKATQYSCVHGEQPCPHYCRTYSREERNFKSDTQKEPEGNMVPDTWTLAWEVWTSSRAVMVCCLGRVWTPGGQSRLHLQSSSPYIWSLEGSAVVHPIQGVNSTQSSSQVLISEQRVLVRSCSRAHRALEGYCNESQSMGWLCGLEAPGPEAGRGGHLAG